MYKVSFDYRMEYLVSLYINDFFLIYFSRALNGNRKAAEVFVLVTEFSKSLSSEKPFNKIGEADMP